MELLTKRQNEQIFIQLQNDIKQCNNNTTEIGKLYKLNTCPENCFYNNCLLAFLNREVKN